MGDISSPIVSKLHHGSYQLSPIIAHARGIYANSITTRDHNLRINTTPIGKCPGLKKRVDSRDLTCYYPHDCWYLLIKAKLSSHSMSTIGNELESTRRQYWQLASICGKKISQGPCIFSNEGIILSFHIPEPRHHRIISKSTVSHSIRSLADLTLTIQRRNQTVIIEFTTHSAVHGRYISLKITKTGSNLFYHGYKLVPNLIGLPTLCNIVQGMFPKECMHNR
jgi:hypothetical protein